MIDLPRPLDPFRSIKLKLGIVVVASELAGLIYFSYKIGWYWLPQTTSITAIGLTLVFALAAAAVLLGVGPLAGAPARRTISLAALCGLVAFLVDVYLY